MKWAPLRIGENKMYTFGVIYVMASVIMFGVINYVTWLEGPVTELTSFLFIMWGSLYAPFFIFYKVAGWNVQEFGLVLNRKVLLVIALSFVMGSYLYIKGTDITIVDKRQYSLIEAFARTGEELYARGFIYTLLLKLYADKKDPWKWAVILSTAAFTAMHTQTFLLEYGTFIFQVFLISLFLTYLRHLTDSILPGITIHCFIKVGLSVFYSDGQFMLSSLCGLINGAKIIRDEYRFTPLITFLRFSTKSRGQRAVTL